MQVLVAYATRHGATAGIAERIAGDLRTAGLEVTCSPVQDLRDLGSADAVVLGGAAYLFHWLKDATAFARRHRAELAERPVWLFSSGPLGTERVDTEGRDVLETSRPKEFDDLLELLHPRDERVFFGAWDPAARPVGLAERIMRAAPASARALPSGDFRDWDAIDGWAAEIAAALSTERAPGRGPGR
ncbi:MAG: flavodoxin domain-containing protein [Amnibacterium sp.]